MDLIHKKYLEKEFIDFIIIDECMPFMKGSSLISLLKQMAHEKSFYNITIISYTSFDSIEKKKFILDKGADYIINKPIQYDDFKIFFKSICTESSS
jgi:response regulator RpfG family c-di-GMP phosphodiesterase